MRLSATSTRKGHPSVSRVLGRILLSGILVSFPATLTVIAQQGGAITISSTITSEAISDASEFESSDDANLLPAPADEVVPAVDRDESKAISRTFLATAYCLKGQTASGLSAPSSASRLEAIPAFTRLWIRAGPSRVGVLTFISPRARKPSSSARAR